MIHLEESVFARRHIGEVFHYVSFFCNIEQWHPFVAAARKVTPGPVGKGTEFEIKRSLFGFNVPVRYRIVEFHKPCLLRLVGHGPGFASQESIHFQKAQSGTSILHSLALKSERIFFIPEKLLAAYLCRTEKKALQLLGHAFNGNKRLPEKGPLDVLMDKAVLPGLLTFSKYGYRLRKKSWKPMTAYLKGRTVLVTGATSGLGKAAAFECARLGAKTIVVGRDSRKVDSVCSAISAETGNERVRGEVADLSIKAEIRSLAEKLDLVEPLIHVLINNAGAMFDERAETVEGLERSLAVNLVGPFLLTVLLLPKLKASAPSRVINVSSGGMYTQRLAADDLAYKNSAYNGEKAYARTKRGLVVLSEIMARKYEKYRVAVNAMHPGWTQTPGIKTSLPKFYNLTRSILRSPEQGADTIVWLAAAEEAAAASGGFWFDRRPHVTYVFSGTVESEGERSRFLSEVEKIAEIKLPE